MVLWQWLHTESDTTREIYTRLGCVAFGSQPTFAVIFAVSFVFRFAVLCANAHRQTQIRAAECIEIKMQATPHSLYAEIMVSCFFISGYTR